MQIQQEEEMKAVEGLINSESQTREQKELEKKKQNILDIIKKNGDKVKQQEDSLDDTINTMTKTMKYNMVQSLQAFEKVVDPTMCYFSEYTFPKEVKNQRERMNYVCGRLINPNDLDVDQINSCLIEDYFCDVCCDSNIGAGKETLREQCVMKCREFGEVGESNIFELNYQLA